MYVKNFIAYLNDLISKGIYMDIILLGIIMVISVVVGKVCNALISKLTKVKKRDADSAYIAFFKAISKSIPIVVLTILFTLAINALTFPDSYSNALETIQKVLVSLSFGFFAFYLVDVPSVLYQNKLKNVETDLGKIFLPALKKTLRIVILIFIVFHIVHILSDKPIASIIAGLGIGGLAVALAVQDTIKHFIGSFVIVGDKPFAIGDRVVIDGHDGPIESIGLRSTRIRTLNGHLVSIPNGELANKTIQNIGKREYIKHEGNITITYETSPEKVQRAIDIMKELLDNHEGMNPEFPPKVYFNKFNSESLNIFYIYWYFPPAFWDYMDFSQKFNFELLKRFNDEGIEFAYPTQKLFVENQDNK